MLNISKTTNLSGNSTIGAVTAATMYAAICEDGSVNISANTCNTELAAKNKETVRNDIAAFQEAVYAAQDQFQKELQQKEA